MLNEKQFTVGNLVGDGPKYPYSYLGEFLDETYRKNKDRFEILESSSKKTRESLAKLEEYIDHQLGKELPKAFADTKRALRQELQDSDQILTGAIRTLNTRTLEELFPKHEQMIRSVESQVQKLELYVPESINIESQKLMKHVLAAADAIEKIA